MVEGCHSSETRFWVSQRSTENDEKSVVGRYLVMILGSADNLEEMSSRLQQIRLRTECVWLVEGSHSLETRFWVSQTSTEDDVKSSLL